VLRQIAAGLEMPVEGKSKLPMFLNNVILGGMNYSMFDFLNSK